MKSVFQILVGVSALALFVDALHLSAACLVQSPRRHDHSPVASPYSPRYSPGGSLLSPGSRRKRGSRSPSQVSPKRNRRTSPSRENDAPPGSPCSPKVSPGRGSRSPLSPRPSAQLYSPGSDIAYLSSPIWRQIKQAEDAALGVAQSPRPHYNPASPFRGFPGQTGAVQSPPRPPPFSPGSWGSPSPNTRAKIIRQVDQIENDHFNSEKLAVTSEYGHARYQANLVNHHVNDDDLVQGTLENELINAEDVEFQRQLYFVKNKLIPDEDDDTDSDSAEEDEPTEWQKQHYVCHGLRKHFQLNFHF